MIKYVNQDKSQCESAAMILNDTSKKSKKYSKIMKSGERLKLKNKNQMMN